MAAALSAAVTWGLLQPWNDKLSIWHWNVEPGSLEVNAKTGWVLRVVPTGPPVMVVLGGMISCEVSLGKPTTLS